MSALDVINGSKRWAIVHADCIDEMASWPVGTKVDHVVTDPPYSEHVHGKTRRSGQGLGVRPLGFDALTDDVREACAAAWGDLVRRWCLVFCNAELLAQWDSSLSEAGLRHIRVGVWVKPDSQPPYSGDRPAPGFECVQIHHSPGNRRQESARGVAHRPTRLNW
jgi:DNA modification methylase